MSGKKCAERNADHNMEVRLSKQNYTTPLSAFVAAQNGIEGEQAPKLSGAVHQADRLISSHLLTRSARNTFPESENQALLEDLDIVDNSGEVLEKSRYFYQVFENDKGIISRKKVQPIEQFYEKFKNNCPNIKNIASELLRKEIKKRLNVDVDPDNTYFLHFDWAMNDSTSITGFSHGGKPVEERTLTECLFSNFPADAQDNPIAVDQQAGIYKVNSTKETEFNGYNQEKIRPSDLMKIIWDIDFYNVAKARMEECWENLEIHAMENAVSFSMKLSKNSSDLEKNDIEILLRGVDYIKNNGETKVYQFDINGYEATDMLVFEDRKSGSRVLYMPRSEKSFIAFRGEFEMREWIINNCSDEEHRESIARHFSIELRQDGLSYSGVDSWLQTLENVVDANKELKKIC